MGNINSIEESDLDYSTVSHNLKLIETHYDHVGHKQQGLLAMDDQSWTSSKGTMMHARLSPKAKLGKVCNAQGNNTKMNS